MGSADFPCRKTWFWDCAWVRTLEVMHSGQIPCLQPHHRPYSYRTWASLPHQLVSASYLEHEMESWLSLCPTEAIVIAFDVLEMFPMILLMKASTSTRSKFKANKQKTHLDLRAQLSFVPRFTVKQTSSVSWELPRGHSELCSYFDGS